MSKILIFIGIIFVILGVAWPLISELGLGRLPGDLNIKGKGFSFFFPVTTCILLSLIVSGMIRIWHKFFR